MEGRTVQFPQPGNEPVLTYTSGSLEREQLEREVEKQSRSPAQMPLWIGGQAVYTKETRESSSPHDHALALGACSLASREEARRAIRACAAAKPAWARLSLEERGAIFMKAAALLAGPWRLRLNAATVLNQSKTPHQAEIDAACELIDFFRFNVHFAEKLAMDQPLSTLAEHNHVELRPLDGFIYAVTPFNFTSIAGNLPTAPALMGNTVLWKPSPHAVLSAHWLMLLLREAGLPDGVINLVNGDATEITQEALGHRDFAGLHFTGSTAVLQQLWSQIGRNLQHYQTYPRIVGESGGKDFIFAHSSSDLEMLCAAIVRGGFELQGQKCSAVSRIYIPRSLWPRVEARLCELIEELRVGDPMDPRNFMGAVISRQAFEKIKSYLELASSDGACRVVVGGQCSDDEGFFVRPALIEVQGPKHRLMREEIFGPVVSAWVYEDDRFEEVLGICDQTSPYALTGAIFARDRAAIATAKEALRFSAGNFYINDKPTGAVVGQQPFGGSRWSGTNDKAGSAWNLMRWVSPRTIKENYVSPTSYRYPFME